MIQIRRGTRASFPPSDRRNRMRGFSMIEMALVVGIIFIMTVIGFVSILPALRQAHLDAAYNTTISAMDMARAKATGTRRVYQVTFTLPGTITITDAVDATAAPILTTTLPTDVSFDAELGIPNTNTTAPDRIGNGQADGPICFDIGVTINCANSFLFYPDGSARDAAGNVNNGVVYMAQPGVLLSSRAVTLHGLSGRIRGWRVYKQSGATYWRQQ